jgi:hypothetical protein
MKEDNVIEDSLITAKHSIRSFSGSLLQRKVLSKELDKALEDKLEEILLSANEVLKKAEKEISTDNSYCYKISNHEDDISYKTDGISFEKQKNLLTALNYYDVYTTYQEQVKKLENLIICFE